MFILSCVCTFNDDILKNVIHSFIEAYVIIEGEIRVKSCLPDDYIEVLHLCLENDCTCHGILKITAIHFVSIFIILFIRGEFKIMQVQLYLVPSVHAMIKDATCR